MTRTKLLAMLAAILLAGCTAPPPAQVAATDGQTAVTFANGDRYVGVMQNGLPNGHGVYTWPDGDVCDGQFKDGVLNGHAVCTTPSGHYTGEFRDGGFGLHHPG